MLVWLCSLASPSVWPWVVGVTIGLAVGCGCHCQCGQGPSVVVVVVQCLATAVVWCLICGARLAVLWVVVSFSDGET